MRDMALAAAARLQVGEKFGQVLSQRTLGSIPQRLRRNQTS